MAEIDLEDKYIKFIKDTIGAILPDAEIYIYGSRVQGKACNYSDVDIALQAPDKKEISFDKLLKIKSDFENSTFPYKVDIVDLQSLSEKFLSIIEKDLQKIK